MLKIKEILAFRSLFLTSFKTLVSWFGTVVCFNILTLTMLCIRVYVLLNLRLIIKFARTKWQRNERKEKAKCVLKKTTPCMSETNALILNIHIHYCCKIMQRITSFIL